MPRQVTAAELQANFLALLDEVENGEEIGITREGRIVARLERVRKNPKALKGRLAGIARTASDDDDLLSTGEEWEAS